MRSASRFARPPLNDAQLEPLIEAGKANWWEVEPAIFGTLLERALDQVERHKLGGLAARREPASSEVALLTRQAIRETLAQSLHQRAMRGAEYVPRLLHVRLLTLKPRQFEVRSYVHGLVKAFERRIA
ncbi:hypothetical protein GC176_12815 [bacterium]|nr:hypothetical protein [bacterium]